MTHSPDFGATFWYWNRCRLLDCVSYRSGTRFFWYQIMAPVGCVFCFVPISGMHVMTMATSNWSMPLFAFCLYTEVLLFVVFFSVQFLRHPCWFSAPIYWYQITSGTKNRSRKLAPKLSAPFLECVSSALVYSKYYRRWWRAWFTTTIVIFDAIVVAFIAEKALCSHIIAAYVWVRVAIL